MRKLGGMLRRPAAKHAARRGRARPAAAAHVVETPEQVKDKYLKGKEVLAERVPPGAFQGGDWIKATSATYFQQPADAAGRVVREHLESGERELLIELSGTQNEEVLKQATAQDPRPAVFRWHLCGSTCTGLRSNPDLLHVQKLKKVDEKVGTTWETNLEDSQETGLLRAEHEQWKTEKKADKDKKKKKKDGSSSEKEKDKEKGKKKSKEKEKKKKKKDKKEETSSSGKTTSESSKKKKKKRIGGKAIARKGQKACYAGTGMDPDYAVRRKLTKKVRRSLKKSRDLSSGSDSKSDTDEEEDDTQTVLSDRNKIQRIHSMAPGLLSALTLGGMKPHITSLGGSHWDDEEHDLPPIVAQYHRHFMAAKLTGSMSREATTLAWLSDLLVQGRVAEALDCSLQRLKAIEMISTGVNWSQALKIEIPPGPEPTMSSRAELQVASKEMKLDAQVKGSGGDKGQGKGKGKGKDKGKEKSKKGKEDNKKQG